MIRLTRSLRFRVAAAFATVGGVVSLLMAVGLYFGAKDAGERLIDETLAAEMQDYVARRARNPDSLPPSTATLVGYAQRAGADFEPTAPPAAVAALMPGHHDIQLARGVYRAFVADHNGERYTLLYNETLLLDTQRNLQRSLALFVVLMTLLSGGIAFRLADRAIEPVKLLARRVRAVEPDAHPTHFGEEFPHDEVGELARSFEHTLARLADFIDRERAFTSDVSHELRTPIAIIRGAAEVLLADETCPDKHRQRLLRIERAAVDMADLSTALLAMARERDEDRTEPVNLVQVVEETIEKNRHLLGERAVEVIVEIDAQPSVMADANLVAIVVANLLRNSFTYTERGSIRIHLDSQALSVTDTGIGIPHSALGQVFKRHFKGAQSGGAGIGLALVSKICVRYGWTIALHSEEGKGTKAELRFPALTFA